MKVALVHDWLVSFRGGEKVLVELMKLYPQAPIYTLFYDPKSMPEFFEKRQIISPNYLKPFIKIRKALLPFLPAAIEALPLEDYDLVISTSSCVAKGVLVGPEAKHISYIHSPMRYIWDQREHYLRQLPGIPGLRGAIHWLSHRLRLWDSSANQRVDHIVVNSSFVGQRVRKYYGRSSEVIAPPVDVARFKPNEGISKKGYFLVAGAFVSYKRLDIAIRAAKIARKPLVVAGNGPELANLQSLADKNVRFVIQPDDETWVRLFQEADAFLFPAMEDFGITAIEAMASGTPVIAFQAGGALDFIRPGVNGVFFKEQNAESLAECLADFNPADYNPYTIQATAIAYDAARFREAMSQTIARMLQEPSREPR